ncbi:MAG: hypothetical protein OEN56_08420 [Gemmatimonadota bacterium]|nr:hypothetical protein [Gemmatimonadota bacterium]
MSRRRARKGSRDAPVWPDVWVLLTPENFRTYHRDLLDLALRRIRGNVSD